MLLEERGHAGVLVLVRDDLNMLCDVLVSRQLERPNSDLVVVLEKVVGHVAHLARPRRRPHERLAVRADLRDDLPELRLKAHVEHSISLVEHEVCYTTQVCHT